MKLNINQRASKIVDAMPSALLLERQTVYEVALEQLRAVEDARTKLQKAAQAAHDHFITWPPHYPAYGTDTEYRNYCQEREAIKKRLGDTLK